MSDTFRVSGKKALLPKTERGWKFTPRPGGWVIAEGPKGERHRLAALELKGQLSVILEGVLYHGQIQAATRGGSADPRGGDAELIAQFPGKVRKILVTVGTAVKEGEPLLLVEAMKMEFTVKSPTDGKVTRLLVQEGQQIGPGDRFLDFEATPEGDSG